VLSCKLASFFSSVVVFCASDKDSYFSVEHMHCTADVFCVIALIVNVIVKFVPVSVSVCVSVIFVV